MTNILEILKYAMEMEKQGEIFYKKYKDEFESERAKRIFENLAKVEAEHYNILKKHYDMLSENKHWDEIEVDLEEGNKVFEKVLKEEKDKMTSGNLKSNLADLTIMRMAYLIENDFAEFYENAIEKVESPQARNLLKTLSEWEYNHRKLFYNEYKSLMEENWFDQKFYPF
ncbi:ferritin family protein [Thermohalobacter berrensis]|uniref:Rubrerythrin diiron-binding domain-containing protein n=1 Tax=Thermohalobacter berrensis TaxID=99594 RepID=A0A419T8V9_9FIRM|nr:ferritin family protein [Thermohalobacter berrensis]RKD33911.1 hypothetical protein BET03_08260 [Thermohalobacter berrensis]